MGLSVDPRTENRSFLRFLKTTAGCQDCGYNARPEALQFDHRPGTLKSFTIGSRAERMSLRRLIQEIDKCDVVCANCHAVRTADRRI